MKILAILILGAGVGFYFGYMHALLQVYNRGKKIADQINKLKK